MTDNCAFPHDDEATEEDLDAYLDQYLTQVRENIAEYGVHITYVGPGEDEPPFAYTVGLTAHDEHPEFIIDVLPPAVAQHILNKLAFTVTRDGARYGHGDTILGLLGGDYPARLVEVEVPSDLSVANRLYREHADHPVRALHIVFPDKDYQWPWQDGANPNGQMRRGPEPGDDAGSVYSLPSSEEAADTDNGTGDGGSADTGQD